MSRGSPKDIVVFSSFSPHFFLMDASLSLWMQDVDGEACRQMSG